MHVRRRLVGDCASDPPLGATQRALAAARADDVVYGLGAVALARGDRTMALAVADEAARAALAAAIARVGAIVEVVDAPDAWPAIDARDDDEVMPASLLVAVRDEARGAVATTTVSVVGAVAVPAVLQCAPGTTMAELAARAGGALDDDWVAIAGGAPAGHAEVRRLRTTVADWLWRAASACEGCRACTDACPASLGAHALVATLATGRDDGTAPAAFVACTGCGVCDAACPARLSPRALAVDVRERLLRAGAEAAGARAVRPGIDRALLTLRLGLGPYDRAPKIAF